MATEEELEDAKRRMNLLVSRARSQGITAEQLANIPAVRELQAATSSASKGSIKPSKVKRIAKCILIPLLIVWMCAQFACLSIWLLEWPVTRFGVVDSYFIFFDMDTDMEPCVVHLPEILQTIIRPPADCSICRNIKNVDMVTNITRAEFEVKYAYTGTPVIIVDGASNWNATEVFSFEFFKKIYGKDSPSLSGEAEECQFFPYKSNFTSLEDVFNMSDERAHMKEGTEPWYIGWSNCDAYAANTLREYYSRPYFLPSVAESSKTDWIFMGSPGYGAHMHIDNVVNPSWQAQIKGTKKWNLEAPPECYYECPHKIELVVKPGQIFVLDTNIWFHSTEILGDEMSITIGSEYY